MSRYTVRVDLEDSSGGILTPGKYFSTLKEADEWTVHTLHLLACNGRPAHAYCYSTITGQLVTEMQSSRL